MAEPSYIEGKQRDRKAAQLQAKREERWNAKHDTMSGMTIQQAKKVRELEDKHADDFKESVYAVDKMGNVIAKSKSGDSTETSLSYKRGTDFSDSWITHNHPHHEFSEDGSDYHMAKVIDAKDGKRKEMVVPNDLGMAGRIGNSLSGQDLFAASAMNAKGVRARTPTYEYSIERGENGWGGSPEDIEKYWTAVFKETYNKHAKSKYSSQAEYRTAMSRLNALANHKATQAAAKKFGFKYTRTKRTEKSAHDIKMGGLTKAQRDAMALERIKNMSAKEVSRLRRALSRS